MFNNDKVNIETTYHHFLRDTRHCVSPAWGCALFFLEEYGGVTARDFRATAYLNSNEIHVVALKDSGTIWIEDAERIDKMFSNCPAHVEAKRTTFDDGRIVELIYKYYDI